MALPLTVALDPGHGGDDPGSRGASGTPEKYYNLDVAFRAAELLAQAGIQVVLTRTEDRTVSLSERVARAEGAHLWISIHHNASPDHSARGTETLIHPERVNLSGPFAEQVQRRVVRALHTVDRGVKTRSDLYVLNRVTAVPAVIVEVAFIDHPKDEQKVATEAGRQKVAYALVGAIGAYAGVRVPQPVPWGTVVAVAAAVGVGYYAWRVIRPRLAETGVWRISPHPPPGPASA